MRKFFCVIFILFLTFIIVDRVGGFYLGKLAANPNNKRLSKLNYVVNEMDEELLLFGTSRMLHALDPEIIKDSIDLSIFNCAVSGSKNIYTHYMLLNYVLQHHLPRIIVLEVNHEDFLKSDKPYRVNKLMHYYGKNEVCDSFLVHIDNEKGLYVSRLYKYNLIFKDLVKGYFSGRKKWRRDGYEPLEETRKDLSNVIAYKNYYKNSDIDQERLNVLRMFFEKCREKGIRLILVTLPEYSIVDESYYEPVKSLARRYQIPFFDYHCDLEFEKRYEYFSDHRHLKKEGANKLTPIFSHDLKTYL